MIWVILTALAAVCGAAKLNTNSLPPISARTAGGSAGALLAPFEGSQGLPTGGYTNDAQGVVVDAVNPGIRISGLEPTGLGGPRTSYGSKDSKVGDAAFGFSGSLNPGLTRIAPGFGSFIESDEPQADKANGNSLKFTNDVGLENYSYGFETDNGISVGENGDAADGVKAQGHFDDGSYAAQKHNDEGDYSSNGAGNNNGRPTIGGGDATSSGSYVSQSGQRPTSGILVGSYKPGSVGSFSSQGHTAQGFGNKQSSFGIKKDQRGSQSSTVSGGSSSIGGQFGQAGFKDSNIVSHNQLSSQTGSSQSTDSRFGIQTSKFEGSHAHAHASAGSPVRSPSFHNGPSAYSSAVAQGSGIASAFASTAPLGSELKNKYLPPSFGSAGQHAHGSVAGSDSSAGASFPAPTAATASASVLGNQHSYGHINQQQAVPSRFAEGPQATFASSTQKPFISQKPGSDNSYYYKQPSKPFVTPTEIPSSQFSIHQQPNVPVSSIVQQGSKYPNIPSTVATGQYQETGSSNYNGITQASISPFPSGFSSSSSQFASQSSQFGSKPSTQFGQTSQPTSTQFGSTETHSGHKVQGQTQFGQSSTSQTPDSSKSQTQQYHGTIYQYNKPATTLSGNKIQGQTQFGLSGQQTSTQFGSTETHSGHKVQGQAQFVQSGLQVPTQSGSTETHFGHQTSQTSDSSQSPTQQYHGTIYQYNKPATTLPVQGHKDTSSFAQATATSGKPDEVETDSRFGTQQSSSQFGSQPTFQQTQTGSNIQTYQFGQKPIVSSQVSGSKYQFGSSGPQFIQKPVTTQGSIVSSNKNTQSQTSFVQKPIVSSQTTADSGSASSQFGSKPQTTQSSSFTYSQSQSSQFGKKPVASTTQTGTQFGSSGSQFGQNSQSTFGSGSVSTTAKPFSSAYQQTQFGSKPTTTQGSSYTYTQTSQTSEFGKKPVVSTTQTGTQFGSGSQFGQNSQSTVGTGSLLTTAKPFGSSNQQTQFGSTGFQFGQNSQSSQGSGVVSATSKPFGSSYQQTQFGSKPQTTQGSSYTYSKETSQTSQFGKKPVSTAQTGVTSGQNQFGSSGSQFGQNSQYIFGSGSVSSTAKPFGSSYQQTQFSSKPTTTQGSSYTYTQTSQTSEFGKKPDVSTTQTGTQFGSGSQFGQNSQSTVGTGSVLTTAKPFSSSNQQTQFGSTGFQFGQNSQSSQGSGVVSATSKPFGSSYQQTQFGSKPQTTQGSSYTYSKETSQTSQFGQKPVSTAQTGVTSGQNQFGSSGSQFGQNSQSIFGLGSVSSTAKPFGSSYQQTQFSSKPTTTQGSSYTYTQTSQTSEFGKKPVVSTTQTGTQFGSGSQFGQNSQSTVGTGSVLTTAKPFGSFNQQTQFGSTGFQFGQNSQSSKGSGVVSATSKPFGSSYQQTQFGSKPQTTQGSSYTYSKETSQTSQFGKKPVSTAQTGVTSGQNQFGSSGSQFGQNSQYIFGSGSVSSTAKPFGSSYQQTQFSSKPTTTQGSSYTYTQTSQTSEFGKKPDVSTTQTGTQFGSGSQFGQNSQSTFGSGLVSTTAKPFGSSYQQTGSQFGQNTESSVGAGSVSSTVKPSFGSSYQQTQIGSKPQKTQGSSFTYSQATGQTSEFGKIPIVSTAQTGAQQTQFGSSSSQFGQNSQSTFNSGLVSTIAKPVGSSYQQTGSRFGENVQSSAGVGSVSTTVKPAFGSSYQQTQFGSKPQTTQGSSFTYTQSQTSQFGKKPVVSTTQTGTQFGSGSQFSQNSQSAFGSDLVSTTAKPVGSSYQQTGSQFGQNVQSSSGAGTVYTTIKPAIGSSYQQTQFGSKPSTTQGSSYTYTQSQTSQFEKKPVVSTTQTGTQFGSGSQFGQNSQSAFGSGLVSTTAKPFGSSYQQTGSQFGQNVQSSSGAGSVSTTVKPAFGSSYQQTQFGSKPSTTQGSGFTYTQSQTSQFGKKPVVSTTQTGTQFGSVSQFGQNSQSAFGSGLVATTAKPFGSSYQQTGSQFSQNVQSSSGAGLVTTTVKPAFGSSYQQTQFGSKPQTTQGSSYTYTQSQTSQFGKKPVVSTTQTGTQFGSGSKFGQNSQFGSSGYQFGQNSQSTFGSGSVLTTAKPLGSSYQQTGSRFGENVQSSAGAGSVSTTVKPAFGSSFQQTQFGSKPSTTQGSSYTYTQSQTSQFGKKPVVSTTQTGTQFGSGSKFGQNSQFGSSGYQFGQNAQSTVGVGSTTATPTFSQKPFGSTYQQTQFGSKPQTTQGSSFTYSQASGETYQFGKKPVSTTSTGVTPQQTTFGSSGSQIGQNAQPTQGSVIALTTSKPVVGIKPVYQQAQFGSTGSQFGQNSQSGQGFGSVSTTAKPEFGQTSFGSSSQNTQFGSSGSQFVQKPQSASQGSSYSSNIGSAGEAVQTTQFGLAGSSQSSGSQGAQYGSGSSNKVSGSSSTSGSNFQQTQFAGSSGSQIGQTTQYGIKPIGSAQATQASTQIGSTPSRFGEASQTIVPITTVSQIVEPTQLGQKPPTPFGSSTTHFGQKPHAHAFASSTGSNVVPFSSTQTGQISKYETSKFGVQNQGVVSSTQKPVGSFSQTNYQQYHYTQTADKSGSQSQFGQSSPSNVGSGQIGQTTFGAQSQKPFGSQSTQTTYQQTQFTQGQKPFGSSQGSAFQIGGQSIGDQPTQGTVQSTSVTGYNYQKPQSVLTTQYGIQSNGAQDQKVQQSQTSFNSAVSTVQTPGAGQTFKPFGVPSTQGTFQQSQTTVTSSQFGAQAAKPTDFTGPVIQTSYNKFSGKPFQPASTVSTQGSNVQSQSSAVSASLFGLQPTPSTELAHFDGKPEYSVLPSNGVALNPSVFSSTQTPSRVSSNEGLAVQTPVVPVPGYELVIKEGASTNQGLSHSFLGLGEQFGGPRDPPRFDDKTGYHY